MKNMLTPLAKSVIIRLRLATALSAKDKAIIAKELALDWEP